MTSEPTIEQVHPPPRRRVGQVLGWALLGVGTVWTAAALWAVLFVVGKDRGGTELVTAIINPLIPALLLPPGVAIARTGLRRAGPLPLQGWMRSLQRRWIESRNDTNL